MIPKTIWIGLLGFMIPLNLHAEVLCGPGGAPHDTAKYKGKVPKDYMVYGLLDTLNRLDLSPDNKWLDQSVDRARDKASEVQEFYSKRGIRIEEADCVLGPEGESQIKRSLIASSKVKDDALEAEVARDQPKYETWISESFPSEATLRSTCIPKNAPAVSDLKSAQQCVNHFTDTAIERYKRFQRDSVPFVITAERVATFNMAVNAYNTANESISAELTDQIENFTPPGMPELCMADICLGDSILKHADRFQNLSRPDIEAMLSDGQTFCDGRVVEAVVDGTEDLTVVQFRALVQPKGDYYVGVSRMRRDVEGAPRHGQKHKQFVAQVQSHFKDGYDFWDPNNHVSVDNNAGNFVRVSVHASTNEYEQLVEPASGSMCGSVKTITW